MRRMSLLVVTPVSLFGIVAMPAVAVVGPSIDHAPVGCVEAEKFPRLEARFDPMEAVARAVLHFRGEGGPHWYRVAMKPEGAAYSGVLPRPKRSLKSFRYYIEVTDSAFATSRTAEHTAAVVSGPAACQDRLMAGGMGSASVLLEAPAGAPPVPVGFDPAGVVAAGSGSASTAAGATAAGGGGGLATAAIIVGGGAAAAGVAVAVGGGGDDAGSGQQSGGQPPASGGTSPPPGGPTPFYDVRFASPGIDVSVCRGGQALSWSSQAVSPDANGNFDQTWAPNEPNTVRVTGRVTDTAFTATLTCTSGSPSGSLSATGSGGTYQGTFDFAGSRGALSVTRRTQ